MKNNIDNLEIIQSYPLFKANQVLRENQLNDIVKYLEQQDRLSRICLMGTGIVCGLEARWDHDALHVTAGTGVTSEGYLVKSGSKSLNGYHEIGLDPKWFGSGEEGLELEVESTPQVLNLVQKSNEDEDISDLTEGDLSNKVLVLALESLMDEDEGLCGNDCDEKGKSRRFLTRYLLIEKDIAEKLLQATYDPENNHLGETFSSMNALFYYKFSALHPFIERFGFNDGNNDNSVRLNNISSYEEFKRRYKIIIDLLSLRLDTVFNEVNKIFSPVFVPTMVSGEKLVEENLLSEKIKEALTNERYELNIQYVHDYLCDLVHAYGELMEAVYELVADCPPNIHRYPKFLWIRGFVDAEENHPFSIYRTPYTQPPIYNGNQSRQAETVTLLERLRTLINGDVFRLPENRDSPEIRITPSKSDKYPLSQRAIPFYYTNQEGVIDNWSPRLKRLGRAGKVFSYHRTEGKPFEEPLTYRMEGSDFLRVEGHIGMQFHDVIRDITDLRQRYNLPFEMVALKIGTEFDDELFQFICKDLDCERRNYLDHYARLRMRVFSAFPEGEIHEELIQLIPEELGDLSSDHFAEKYDKLIEQHQRHDLPSSVNFLQIHSCYRELMERWERTKKKHLFHHFALEHPGMKHRGGVPIGGTLILAYVDLEDIQPLRNGANMRTERIEAILAPSFRRILNRELSLENLMHSRIIVGDFYLPYSCVSGCIPHSIIAERPRPVLRVSPAVFCEGDTNATTLEISVQPEGGILTGPGYSFEEGRHLFTPSESGISEGTVELKYFVDGGEATYLLTIVKLPEVGFNIIDEAGNTVSEVCQNSGHLTFQLSEGVANGQFRLMNWDEDLSDHLTITENGTYVLDPMELTLDPEEPLQLQVSYTVEGNLCGNQLTRELTILPAPDAEFIFEDNVDEVCSDNERIEILPNQQGGIFSAHIENRPIENIISQEGDRWFVNLLNIHSPNQQRIQLHIRQTINTEHGCGNTAEHLLTIWSIQETDFNLPDRVCQNDDPFNLSPQPEGGNFDYRIEEGELEFEDLIENNVFFPNRIQTDEVVVVTVGYSVNIGACSGSATKQIEVHPTTQVDFQARFVSRVDEPNAPFSVRFEEVDPATIQGEYIWGSNSGTLSQILNERFGKTPPEEPISFEQDFEGELWIELSVRDEICQSETTRKQVLPAIDSFSLIIEPPDIIVSRPTSDQSIPLQDGAVIDTFRFREQPFFVRTTTLPHDVDFVEIELEHEGQSVAKERTQLNQEGNGYDLKTSEGIKPATGTYRLRATPILEPEDGSGELPGLTTEISFSIVQVVIDREDNPIPPVRGIPEEIIPFLRRRDSVYREEMEELRTDPGLARTTSFEKTEGFLHSQSESEDFEHRYFELVDTLERAAKRTESGSTRQSEIFKLMEIATKYFMDREIVKSPDNISDEILGDLSEKITRMEEVGFDRETLISNWAVDSLQKELNAPVTESFKKVLAQR